MECQWVTQVGLIVVYLSSMGMSGRVPDLALLLVISLFWPLAWRLELAFGSRQPLHKSPHLPCLLTRVFS
jgi:hypothetical protein